MTVYEILNQVEEQLRKCGPGARRLLLRKLQWLIDQYMIEGMDE